MIRALRVLFILSLVGHGRAYAEGNYNVESVGKAILISDSYPHLAEFENDGYDLNGKDQLFLYRGAGKSKKLLGRASFRDGNRTRCAAQGLVDLEVGDELIRLTKKSADAISFADTDGRDAILRAPFGRTESFVRVFAPEDFMNGGRPTAIVLIERERERQVIEALRRGGTAYCFVCDGEGALNKGICPACGGGGGIGTDLNRAVEWHVVVSIRDASEVGELVVPSLGIVAQYDPWNRTLTTPELAEAGRIALAKAIEAERIRRAKEEAERREQQRQLQAKIDELRHIQAQLQQEENERKRQELLAEQKKQQDAVRAGQLALVGAGLLAVKGGYDFLTGGIEANRERDGIGSAESAASSSNTRRIEVSMTYSNGSRPSNAFNVAISQGLSKPALTVPQRGGEFVADIDRTVKSIQIKYNGRTNNLNVQGRSQFRVNLGDPPSTLVR